jgi:prepilin-type N-terminal cleavage/methylation domain-containing protein
MIHAHINPGSRAFTLVEVMVSVSIFSMVMLISTGAVFSIVEANKKAHSIKSVMTNLNFALESMSRDIRVGSNYRCDDGTDCVSPGGTAFKFRANRDVNGDGTVNLADEVTYSRSGSRIMRQVNGQLAFAITASEITVTNLRFYVSGTASGGDQPRVTTVIQGYSGTSTTRSDFNINTTISQRASNF